MSADDEAWADETLRWATGLARSIAGNTKLPLDMRRDAVRHIAYGLRELNMELTEVYFT